MPRTLALSRPTSLYSLLPSQTLTHILAQPCPAQHLSTTPSALQKPLPPRIPIPETDLIENFLKGTGPGGQKINKTSSAVQLKHIPTGIVVKCQATRSRSQNRKYARRLLGDRLEEALLGEGARTEIRAREERRKKASSAKKSKRKYNRLAETGSESESEHAPEPVLAAASAGASTFTDGVGMDRSLDDGPPGDEDGHPERDQDRATTQLDGPVANVDGTWPSSSSSADNKTRSD